MVFDSSDPMIDESEITREYWATSEFVHLEYDKIPSNIPESRGFGFIVSAYVDADHDGDTTARQFRAGFIFYINNAPLYWISKKQSYVETSSFCSEFMAMKHMCEYLRGFVTSFV